MLVQQAALPLTQSHSQDLDRQLYSFFRAAADWPVLLASGHTFSVEARVAGRTDVTEQFLRLRARDAICDAVRESRWAALLLVAASTTASQAQMQFAPKLFSERSSLWDRAYTLPCCQQGCGNWGDMMARMRTEHADVWSQLAACLTIS